MPVYPPEMTVDRPLISIRGEPGVGVVGTNRYEVGVQPAMTAPDAAAWQSRQPNLDVDKATEEANRVAKEGLYLDHLLLNKRTQNSAAAVNAAMTFQAMRSYERDLQTAKSAGLSDEQAAVQAFFRNPRAVNGTQVASMVRATTPAPEPFVPTTMDMPGVGPVIRQGRYGEKITPTATLNSDYQPNVVTLPDGTQVLRTGPKQSQLLKKDTGITGGQQVSALSAQARILSNQLSDMPPRDPRRTTIGARLDRITDELDALLPKSKAAPENVATPEPAAGTVRVTSKAERDALPKGTKYIGPDGKSYIKQ